MPTSSINSFYIVFVALSVLLCLAPIFYKSSQNTMARNDEDLRLHALSMSSSVFSNSLLASCAAAFPILIDSCLAVVTHQPLKLKLSIVAAKVFPAVALFTPDIIILSVMEHSYDNTYFTSWYCIRMTLLFSSMLHLTEAFKVKPIFNTNTIRLVTTMFGIGQILTSNSTTIDSAYDFNIFLALKIICQSVGVLLLVKDFFPWLEKLISKPSSRSNFMEIIFTFLSVVLIVLGCLLDTVFGYVPLPSRDMSYFSAVTYTTSVLTIILLVMSDYVQKFNDSEELVIEKQQTKMLFLRYFSSELRKPVTDVSVGLAFIKVEISSFVDQDLVSTVQQAVQSCETSIQILDNILLYDKLTTNSVTMYMKQIPFNSFIRKAVRPFISMAKDKAIVINDCVVNDSAINTTLVYINADSNRLCHVLRTLLVNAIQFSKPRGQITITLDFRCDVTDAEGQAAALKNGQSIGTLVFSLEDKGVGIHPSRLVNIFDGHIEIESHSAVTDAAQTAVSEVNGPNATAVDLPSKRIIGGVSSALFGIQHARVNPGDTGSKTRVKEAQQSPRGLGLWIAKRIIDLHPKYEIAAFSGGVNKGAKFTICMPFFLSTEGQQEIGVFEGVEATASFNAAELLFQSHEGLVAAPGSLPCRSLGTPTHINSLSFPLVTPAMSSTSGGMKVQGATPNVEMV